MPRYFFNISDGETILDNEGTVLPDLAAAREEAVCTSAELLRGGPKASQFWDGTPWQMWITDENKQTLFTINFSGAVA